MQDTEISEESKEMNNMTITHRRTRVPWSGWTAEEDVQIMKNHEMGEDMLTGVNAGRIECMERYTWLVRRDDPNYGRRPIPWTKQLM